MRSKSNLLGVFAPILFSMLFIAALFAGLNIQTVIAEPTSPDANPQFRIAHVAPWSDTNTAVTVTISSNTNELITGFESIIYEDSTSYFPIDEGAGDYIFRVFTDISGTPAIERNRSLEEDTDYTVVIIGGAKDHDLDLLIKEDDNSAPASGKANVRFGHLAPFHPTLEATEVDIRRQDGAAILIDVPYGSLKNGFEGDSYLEFDAGPLDLKITTPGGDRTLIDPEPVTLNDGDIIDIYATGDANQTLGTNQPLGIFGWPSDDSGQALPLSTMANLQVVHLAPLDPLDGSTHSTAITITLDGTPIVSNFKYGDSTNYQSMTAKSYSMQVYIEGEPSYSISRTLTLDVGMDYTLFARGGNINWVFDTVLIANNNAGPASGEAKVRFGNYAPFLTDSRVDIRLQDGTVVVSDLYLYFTDYMTFTAGTIDFKITTVGGNVTLVDPDPLLLTDGAIGTLVAAGDDQTKPLQAFYIPDAQMGYFLPDSSTPPPAVPGLAIEKSPDLQDVAYGETVTFTISLTNTGTVSLTNVTITDTLAPDCNRSLGTVEAAVNQSYTCTQTNVTKSFLNEVVATGKPVSSEVLTARDLAAVNMTTKLIYLPILMKD